MSADGADKASWPPSEETTVAGPGDGVPTCYRHPRREAHIRCVRCDRPICPDCMIPAAVGFQCPECVRKGHTAQRVARTAFGGRVSPNKTLVTYTLIGINIVFFLIQQASPSFTNDFSMLPGPARFRFGGPLQGVSEGEYYRLVTGMFLHANAVHILFNMWALYVVGGPLEALLGRLRFTALYFLSGLSGSALVYLLADPRSTTVGASGAIFGLFGALFIAARRLNFNIGPIGLVLVLNLVLTFTIPGISWQGHIGGLVAGAALALAWVYTPRKQRTAAQLASSIAVAAIIVIVVLARTQALTG